MTNKYFSKPAITSGVIAAILVLVFVEPLLEFFGNFLIFLGTNLYSGWLDSLYKSSALGHRNDVTLAIFAIILVIICWSVIFSFSLFLIVIDVVTDKKEAPPDIGIRIIDFLFKHTKIMNTLMTVFISSFFLLILFSLTTNFVDLQLNTSFNQRLTALAPAISDQQYEEFRAAWAIMSSRSDYDAINEQLETIARNAGISLPELLLD